MRHFLRPRGVQRHSAPIATLPFGVSMASLSAGLVTLPGVSYRALPGRVRAALAAIAVAAITVTANRHRLATTRAQVAPSRNAHGPSGPMGLDGNARFVTYSACNVACRLRARLRFWLGGWVRDRASISTGRFAFYPICAKPAALRLPDSLITSRSSRREPRGRFLNPSEIRSVVPPPPSTPYFYGFKAPLTPAMRFRTSLRNTA